MATIADWPPYCSILPALQLFITFREGMDKYLSTIRSWAKIFLPSGPHTTHAYTSTTNTQDSMIFDTDSRSIKIDDYCCSTSISTYLDDFVGEVTPSNYKIKGIGNIASNIFSGTILWKITDDAGGLRSISLPNYLYVPEAPTSLLSPQHWAQTAKDNKPIPDSTWWLHTLTGSFCTGDSRDSARLFSWTPAMAMWAVSIQPLVTPSTKPSVQIWTFRMRSR